jgi:hypothetical protein
MAIYRQLGRQEKLIKVMRLDVHGNCVWDNKIEYDDLEGFRGSLSKGLSLTEFVDSEYCDPRSCQRGAVLFAVDEGYAARRESMIERQLGE